MFKDYFGISASDYRKTNDIPLKDSYLHVADHIKSMKKTDDLIGNIGVWLTVPLTELVTFIVAYTFMRKSRLELLIRDL